MGHLGARSALWNDMTGGNNRARDLMYIRVQNQNLGVGFRRWHGLAKWYSLARNDVLLARVLLRTRLLLYTGNTHFNNLGGGG